MARWTAGVGTSYGSYTLYLDVWTGDNPGGNGSTVYWNAFLHKDLASGYAYNLNNDTWFYCYVNGVQAEFYGGYDFRSPNNYAGATRGISSGSTYIGHNANGTQAITVRLAMSGPGPLTSGDTGWQTFTMSDYDTRVNTPNTPSVSRTADGTSITMSTATSTNNNGPNADYFHWYYSTDNSSWVYLAQTNPTSTNATSFTWNQTGNGNNGISPNPNTLYYFRAYAHNGDNTHNSGWTAPSGSNYAYGVPGAPTALTATRSTTDSGKINLSWTAPSNTQGGITGYDIFIGDTYVETTTSTSFASIKSTYAGAELTPGTSYTYRVAAKNAVNTSSTNISTLAYSVTPSGSAVTAMAPGIPNAPTGSLVLTKVGRNVTVDSESTGSNNGVSINIYQANQGYFVQYQSALTQNGTYGYGGTAGAWSPAIKMSNQTDFKHTYELLPAALWYKFRVYAANTVVNNKNGSAAFYPHLGYSSANFLTTSSGIFVSAGGKRKRSASETNPNTYQPTETAKRYGVEGSPPLSQTVKYWDLTTAKRFALTVPTTYTTTANFSGRPTVSLNSTYIVTPTSPTTASVSYSLALVNNGSGYAYNLDQSPWSISAPNVVASGTSAYDFRNGNNNTVIATGTFNVTSATGTISSTFTDNGGVLGSATSSVGWTFSAGWVDLT